MSGHVQMKRFVKIGHMEIMVPRERCENVVECDKQIFLFIAVMDKNTAV